ncbi:MAG TPA: phage tail protein [Longimicrobium sp.]|nr:phage tail protein [Longimicrobium sp.]
MAAAVGRWRLSGANGWGAGLSAGRAVPVTVTADGVVAGRAVLALRPAPGGPLDPAALAATVGGLTPPPAMAVGDGEIILAVPRRGRVLRWDGGRLAFVPWITLPGLGRGDAAVLERAGGLLAVSAVGARRVAALDPRAGLVFDDAQLPAGHALRDLAAGAAGEILLLLRAPGGGSVWGWRPGWEGVRRRARLPDGAADAARLLKDAEGRSYAFDRAGGRLIELGPDGSRAGEWTPLEALRERFAPLPVAVEPDPARGWRLRVPPRFGQPSAPPIPWPAPPAWPAFGPDGEGLRLPPEAEVGRPPYGAAGTLEVGPLDGRLPRVVWDRVEVDGALPAGTAVRVSTRTSESESPPTDDVPWSPPHRLVGGKGEEDGMDVAVQSAPGRFLWLRLELEGGSATPLVRAVTAGFPRRGIVDYLPAVFREQDQDTRFLERFVGALEQTWAPLEEAAASFDRQLRPQTAEPAMLGFLASWLDQPLEPGWGEADRRRAVEHAAEHLFLRGTPRGVQAALRLHLAARRGVDPARLAGQPFIWEHFRSRYPARAGAGRGAPGALFGSEVLRRLRLGASELGEGTLRDLGAPGTDAVAVHAHRFTVFVPRALAPGPDDLAALRAVLRREQPAGAVGEVVVVEPRMRVGAQATLGVDTTLGVYPTARLAAAGDTDAPAARLDYDCLLADAGPGAGPAAAAGGPGRGPLPWRVG